jgi:hypothetical protein
MARAGYRPASDGYGHVQLTPAWLKEGLDQEAVKYAMALRREEDGLTFRIGCSDYSTNRAFALCVEAARLLRRGGDAPEFAATLMKLAVEEIEARTKRPA